MSFCAASEARYVVMYTSVELLLFWLGYCVVLLLLCFDKQQRVVILSNLHTLKFYCILQCRSVQ